MSNILCSLQVFRSYLEGKKWWHKPMSDKDKNYVYDQLSMLSKAWDNGEYSQSKGVDFTAVKKIGWNNQQTFKWLWEKYTHKPELDPGVFPITIQDIRKFKVGLNYYNKRVQKPRSYFARKFHLPVHTLRNFPETMKFEGDIRDQTAYFRNYSTKTSKASNSLFTAFNKLSSSLGESTLEKLAETTGIGTKRVKLAQLQKEWTSLFQKMQITSDPSKLSILKGRMSDVNEKVTKLYTRGSGRAFEINNEVMRGVDPNTIPDLSATQKSHLKQITDSYQVVRVEGSVSLIRGLQKVKQMAETKNLEWAGSYVDKLNSYIKQIEFQHVVDKRGKKIDHKYWHAEKDFIELGFKPDSKYAFGPKDNRKVAFSEHYMTQYTIELTKTIKKLEQSISKGDYDIDKALKIEIDSWEGIAKEARTKDVGLNRVYSVDPYFFVKAYVSDVGIFNYQTHVKDTFARATTAIIDQHLLPARKGGHKHLEDTAIDILHMLRDVYTEIQQIDPTQDRHTNDLIRALTSVTYFRLMGGNLRSATRNGTQRMYEVVDMGTRAYFQGRSFYKSHPKAKENGEKLNHALNEYGLLWSDGKTIRGGIVDGIKGIFGLVIPGLKKSDTDFDRKLSEQSRGALEDAYKVDGDLYVDKKGELTIMESKSVLHDMSLVTQKIATKTAFAHRVVEDWNRARTFKTAFALAHQNYSAAPEDWIARKILGSNKVAKIKEREGEGYIPGMKDLRDIHSTETQKVYENYIDNLSGRVAYNATMDLHFEYARWNKAVAIKGTDENNKAMKFTKAGIGQFSHYRFSMAALMYKWARDAGLSIRARDFSSEEVIKPLRFGMLQLMVVGLGITARSNLYNLFGNDVIRDIDAAAHWLEMKREDLFTAEGSSKELQEEVSKKFYDQGLSYFLGPNIQVGKTVLDKTLTMLGASEFAEHWLSHENPVAKAGFDKSTNEAIKKDDSQKTYEKLYWVNTAFARNYSYGTKMFSHGGGFFDWLRLDMGVFPTKEQREKSNMLYEWIGWREPKKSRRKVVKKDMDEQSRRRAIRSLGRIPGQ